MQSCDFAGLAVQGQGRGRGQGQAACRVGDGGCEPQSYSTLREHQLALSLAGYNGHAECVVLRCAVLCCAAQPPRGSLERLVVIVHTVGPSEPPSVPVFSFMLEVRSSDLCWACAHPPSVSHCAVL